MSGGLLYASAYSNASGKQQAPFCSRACAWFAPWQPTAGVTCFTLTLPGLLRRWDLQIYQPQRSFYVRFQFDDYREVGSVKFPHYLYVDFYRATFRYTKVVHNPQLRDSDFEINCCSSRR
jgi:hypothetical protein